MQTVGRYELVECLSVGAAGTVYRARADSKLVAVKIATSPDTAEVLRSEHALLQRLATPGHRGLLRVLEQGDCEDGRPWFASEYVSGGSLATRLLGPARSDHRPRRILYDELDEQLSLVRQVADALDYVHRRGAIHADLSPRNVLFADDGSPVLVDFGAAVRERPGLGAQDAVSCPAVTPGFCAPEQLKGGFWDSRVDIYALGCLWYELVAQRPVFRSDHLAGLIQQHLSKSPTPPSLLVEGFPSELEELLLRMLAKDPYERIARGCEVVAWVDRYRGVVPSRAVDRAEQIFNARPIAQETVLAPIREALAGDVPHGPRLYIVQGLPGSGKTRLLEELLRELAERSEWNTVLRSDPHEPASPSAPEPLSAFGQLMAQVAHDADYLRAHSEELAPLLAYSPELAARITASPSPVRASDEAARARIFRALRSLLVYAAMGKKLAVVFDDLQSVDALSSTFVKWLLADGHLELPLVVIATATSDEEHAPWIEELSARASGRFSLAPLRRRDVRRMLTDLLATHTTSEALVDEAQRYALGSPLALTHFAQSLVQSGRLERVDGCAHILADDDVQPPWPATDRVRAFLHELDDRSRHAAGTAAIIGRTFSAAEVAELLGESGDEHHIPIRQLCERLVAERIVRRGKQGSFHFSHELERRALEDSLPASMASQMHAARAAALLRNERSDEVLAAVGLHWARAGEDVLAIRALRVAAKRAAAQLDFERAIELMNVALHLSERAAPLVEKAAARLAIGLLRLYARTARHEPLHSVALRVLAGPTLDAFNKSRVLRLLSASHRVRGDYGACTARLDEAERQLDSVRSSSIAAQRLRIDLCMDRITLHYMTREITASDLLLARVLPVARVYGRPAQRAALYMAAANASALKRRYAFSRRNVRYMRRALALYEASSRNDTQILMAMFDLAFMLLLGARDERIEAQTLLARAAERARALEDLVLRARIYTYHAIAARRMRDVRLCRVLAEAALNDAQDCGLQGYVGAAHGCLAWAALLADRLGEARQHIDRARAAWWRLERTPANRRSEFPFQWLAHLPLLAIQVRDEDFAGCRSTLAELTHRTQAKLMPSVLEPLLAAERGWSTDSEALSRLLDACLREAIKEGYL